MDICAQNAPHIILAIILYTEHIVNTFLDTRKHINYVVVFLILSSAIGRILQRTNRLHISHSTLLLFDTNYNV